jgi:transposase
MREGDRFKVIQAVTEARLRPGQAAERLGLGVRQVERPVRRYEAAGVAGLVSGKRGRPGNHQLPAGNAQRRWR